MRRQPLILDADAVDGLLGDVDVRGALEEMFRDLARDEAVQPPQTLSLFPAGRGDFITYLGVLASSGVFGAKLSPYIPSDETVVTAWTLLMSMRTGEPLLLCDAKRLTTERTAATTAIAADRLAAPSARVLAVVGTGPVGLAHLRYAEGLRPWTEARLCSPGVGKRSGLPSRLETGCPVRSFTDPAEAIAGADVVMLCTSAGSPVIDVSGLSTDALVTSISTNVADAHEIAPEALAALDVYCDFRATTPAAAGEMRLAAAAGSWDAAALRGDLPGLLSQRDPPPSRRRPTFFRSIGLGLEDVAAAAALLAAARG